MDYDKIIKLMIEREILKQNLKNLKSLDFNIEVYDKIEKNMRKSQDLYFQIYTAENVYRLHGLKDGVVHVTDDYMLQIVTPRNLIASTWSKNFRLIKK
jgi:UDP-glucose 6-dehydrogenase